jgi:hypothetical protein
LHRTHSLIVTAALAAAALLGLPDAAGAQVDSRAAGAVRDSLLRPPISARRALLYSMVVPGLGQARLNRATGLMFAAVEALSLAMYSKASREYRLARAYARDSTPLSWVLDPETGDAVRDPETGAPVVAEWSTTRYTPSLLRARKTHVEDWVAVLIFNHLFAGVDAFVGAHLWDLPAQVELRALPRATTLTARIRW